jgi:predicted exporter
VIRREKWVLWLTLAVTLISGALLFTTRFEGNIDLMLPPDKEITRSMDFLRGASFSDKMIISLELTDPSRSKKELFQAVDQLAASLSPPLFMKVMSGFSVANVMEEFSILRYAPQVLGEQDLAAIDAQITPETVSGKLRSIYLQSLRPESIFTSSLSRSDPLGIKLLLLEKMRALPASMGYDVSIEDGHFISRDGRHSMIIIQTSVPMMDSPRSKELVAASQERIGLLPAYVRADLISGHLHTVSNERVIKHDITVVSIIASITFLLLFLVVFRDPRVLFVFIIPLIAVVWAIPLATALQGKLLFLVIGFGTAIAGISIDYGLLVYIAMKRGADAGQFLKLSKLVTIDAITTMFSFIVLFFSLIRGYHQLALFSSLCVVICLLFSLFVLPLILGWKRHPLVLDQTIGDGLRTFIKPSKVYVVVWGVLTVAALFLSFSVTFDSDVKKLDGTEPGVLRAEQTFHDVWGGKANQAVFVVTGKSLEEAMEINDRVYREASAVVGKGEFTSLAQFWPSRKLRTENSERWNRFWSQGREQKLKQLISEASSAQGFSALAFEPFFAGLHTSRSENINANGLIGQLQERFVLSKNGEYRILSYFPDEQKSIDGLKVITRKYPGTFVVSGKALSASISAFTAQEVKLLAPLAILFNILLAWLFFRDWKYTLIALVPLLTGVVWLVGIMSLFHIPLNVINIVAAIVSTGVIVDYGLGIAYEYRHNLRTGTMIAVSLSAATNVIGCGALLFAKHPALYSTGVAMVISMVTGYLSAVFVIPSFCKMLEGKEKSP